MLTKAYINFLTRDESRRLEMVGILLHTTKDSYSIDVEEGDSLFRFTGFLERLREDGVTDFYVTVSDDLAVLPRITFKVDLLRFQNERGIIKDIDRILKETIAIVNKNIN